MRRAVRAARLRRALQGLILVAAAAAGAQAAPPAALDPSPELPAWVRSSFEVFADDWMANLTRHERRTARELGSTGSADHHRRFGRYYEVELRPTGRAAVPFVGILRYTEERWRCAKASQSRCNLDSRNAVSEVFRFQDGRWIY